MMEREWQAEAAEPAGRGSIIAKPAALQSRHPALALPPLRPPHRRPREHPGRQLPRAARPLPALQRPISKRYPLIESPLRRCCRASPRWHFGYGLAGIGALVFVWAMIALCFIDLDTQLLPDSITLPLLWLGLLLNLGGTFTDITGAVVGAAAGYLTLWSVFWLFKLATGKEGMGYGDFKLLAAIGAWLGWQILPLTILLSSLVGAVVGIALIVFRKHGREIPIPFGPYLAAAGLLALYWGKPLTEATSGLL
jgi:leader peptidase (prepilin peptidase)/N-methyltransferase